MYVKGTGGIVGSTATYGNYTITDCSNTGSVSSENLPSTGGIAGSISGLSSSVAYCYNAGNVTGSSPEQVASWLAWQEGEEGTGTDVIACWNLYRNGTPVSSEYFSAILFI